MQCIYSQFGGFGWLPVFLLWWMVLVVGPIGGGLTSITCPENFSCKQCNVRKCVCTFCAKVQSWSPPFTRLLSSLVPDIEEVFTMAFIWKANHGTIASQNGGQTVSYRKDKSRNVCNSQQLSATVLTVCSCLNSLQLSWESETVLRVCNCLDSVQLSW